MTEFHGRVRAAQRPDFFGQTVDRRFPQDRRGRLIPGPGEGDPSVPRFYFGRTVGLTLWRFSATLAPQIVSALARLAALEGPLPREAAERLEVPPPPKRLAALADVLAANAVVQTRFRGPLLTLRNPVPARSCENVKIRRLSAPGDFQGLAFAAERAGAVVAACRTVRRWPGWGAELRVETEAPHRGNGYGGEVVRAWSDAVRGTGEIPLARPEWSNAEFLFLARSLGMQALGEDCELY